MEPESTAGENSLTDLTQEAAEVVDQVSEYGGLIMGSLYVIVGGMFVIYILHKLASKFLFPHMGNRRLIKVIFGTIYVLVLVITALMALKRINIDVTVIGQIALVGVLIGAVVIFFLVPFLPRLPFLTGHMIEVNGELGIVNANAAGVDIFAVCWVKNKDWFSTRSELWLKVVDAFIEDSRVAMSLPQQEVYLIEGNEESKENKLKQ